VTWVVPSERVVVPRSEELAAPEEVGAPLVVTGGHTDAQAPVQLEDALLSPSNMYTVSFLEPAARIVPSLLACLTVTVVPPPAAGVVAVALLVVAALLVVWLAVGYAEAADVALDDLLELPQPAASRADAPRTAIRPVVLVCMRTPTVVDVVQNQSARCDGVTT
jgi:hypothetical protein